MTPCHQATTVGQKLGLASGFWHLSFVDLASRAAARPPAASRLRPMHQWRMDLEAKQIMACLETELSVPAHYKNPKPFYVVAPSQLKDLKSLHSRLLQLVLFGEHTTRQYEAGGLGPISTR